MVVFVCPMSDLAFVRKWAEVFFVLSKFKRFTDRQTDRQIDISLMAKTVDAVR